MRHKSFHEYIFLVSANDVMEHFAFPGNIDFADDDQGVDVFIQGVWKSGNLESGIGTGIGTGTGTGTGIGTGMGRETYIKAGTTFTLI